MYKCTECWAEYDKYTTLCDRCIWGRVEKYFPKKEKPENTMDKKQAIAFVKSLSYKFWSDPSIKSKLSQLQDLLKKWLPEEWQSSMF